MSELKTLQDFFNKAYLGIAAQGWLRGGVDRTETDPDTGDTIPNFACKYRGEEGRKCAIGQCIPDELYSPELESEPTEQVIATVWPWAGSYLVSNLRSLQRVHDEAMGPESMKLALHDYAQRRNLTIPELPQG